MGFNEDEQFILSEFLTSFESELLQNVEEMNEPVQSGGSRNYELRLIDSVNNERFHIVTKDYELKFINLPIAFLINLDTFQMFLMMLLAK